VRAILDGGGLQEVTIFASGGLDEDSLAAFARANAPIDGIGIGTALTTSADVPSIDCVYKLQDYAGQPRRKLSENKATWPGRKQVWRRYGSDGKFAGDLLSLDTPAPPSSASAEGKGGEPLIHQVMQGGRRLTPSPPLDDIRAHARRELERLPDDIRRLVPGATLAVEIADDLVALAADADRSRAQTAGAAAKS
jgi:nicotinate phosphoribosyltransferase